MESGELTISLGPWDITMISLVKSLLLLYLFTTLLMTFLFPVSLHISSHFPVFKVHAINICYLLCSISLMCNVTHLIMLPSNLY